MKQPLTAGQEFQQSKPVIGLSGSVELDLAKARITGSFLGPVPSPVCGTGLS